MLQRKSSVAAGLKAAWAVCVVLTAAVLLGGCGQKGPLFLPVPAAQAAPASPTAAPASSPASAP